MIICMKFINNSIFSLKWKPFFDGIIYGHLQHQVLLFPANLCFNGPSVCHTPDLQHLLHAVRMHPDLIMYTERDQHTQKCSCCKLLLSYWARAAANPCREQKLGEKNPTNPNSYELTSTAMASDQPCHWGTRPKGYNNYSMVIINRHYMLWIIKNG